MPFTLHLTRVQCVQDRGTMPLAQGGPAAGRCVFARPQNKRSATIDARARGGWAYGSGYERQRPRFQVGERVEVSSRAGLVPWVTSGVIAEVGWVYGKPIYRVDKVGRQKLRHHLQEREGVDAPARVAPREGIAQPPWRRGPLHLQCRGAIPGETSPSLGGKRLYRYRVDAVLHAVRGPPRDDCHEPGGLMRAAGSISKSHLSRYRFFHHMRYRFSTLLNIEIHP